MPGRCRRAASIRARTPSPAALRELYEETNIRSVERLGDVDGMAAPTTFRAPIVGQAWKGRYRGQTQKWFALRFIGDDSEIDILTPGGGAHEPEFAAWRWARIEELPDLIVPFKRPVYERVVKEFSRFAAHSAAVIARSASTQQSSPAQPWIASLRSQCETGCGLSGRARLERLEVLELGPGLVERDGVDGVVDVLFGVLDRLRERGGVDLLDRGRLLGEHGQPGRSHLGEAAVDDDATRRAVAVDRQHARLQHRHERRVSRQHAEIAFLARHVDLGDVAREHELFRRHEIEVEGGHEV